LLWLPARFVCDVGCHKGAFRQNPIDLQTEFELGKFKLCEGAPTFCLLLGPHLDKKIDITDHLSG
jgi:hypothetical protein